MYHRISCRRWSWVSASISQLASYLSVEQFIALHRQGSSPNIVTTRSFIHHTRMALAVRKDGWSQHIAAPTVCATPADFVTQVGLSLSSRRVLQFRTNLFPRVVIPRYLYSARLVMPPNRPSSCSLHHPLTPSAPPS